MHQQAWKETKNACLLTLSSEVSPDDHHPQLPTCFTDRSYVEKLVREIHATATGGPRNTAEIPELSPALAERSDSGAAPAKVSPPLTSPATPPASRPSWQP